MGIEERLEKIESMLAGDEDGLAVHYSDLGL